VVAKPMKKATNILDVIVDEISKKKAPPSNGHVKAFSMADLYGEIEDLLQMSSFTCRHDYWLDVAPELNAALGSRTSGIPFGKIVELSGLEHGGKTTIATYIGGLAQQADAGCGYIDFENSRDKAWAAKLGMDLDNVLQLYPRLEKAQKARLAHLQGAEDIFTQAEIAMDLLRQKGFKKQFWMLDSIAMVATRSQIEAGTNGNMRTKVDRAHFLSETLPRWAGLAANYNAMIVLINQLRLKVGKVFGDPLYSPGGKALDHACSVRARVKRYKGGYIRDRGRIIGLQGTITNKKNKTGNGSLPDEKCGFKVIWNKPVARFSFMKADDLED